MKTDMSMTPVEQLDAVDQEAERLWGEVLAFREYARDLAERISETLETALVAEEFIEGTPEMEKRGGSVMTNLMILQSGLATVGEGMENPFAEDTTVSWAEDEQDFRTGTTIGQLRYTVAK